MSELLYHVHISPSLALVLSASPYYLRLLFCSVLFLIGDESHKREIYERKKYTLQIMRVGELKRESCAYLINLYNKPLSWVLLSHPFYR